LYSENDAITVKVEYRKQTPGIAAPFCGARQSGHAYVRPDYFSSRRDFLIYNNLCSAVWAIILGAFVGLTAIFIFSRTNGAPM
jgi:hypothetical protein